MTLQPLYDETHAIANEFEQLLAIADRGRDVARINEAIARLARRTFVVAVVGRQRSGKSTLINALVGEKSRVAPVNVITTTAALSLIARHDTATATVFFNDDQGADIQGPIGSHAHEHLPRPIDEAKRQRLLRHLLFNAPAPSPALPTRQISREELPRWITHQGDKLETSRVVLVQILTNSARLPQHLVLVDSPGIEAPDPNDRILANLIADMADATVMVYSQAANLGREEMQFLVQQLAVKKQREDLGARPYRRRVFLVQNNWSRPTYTPQDQYERDCRKVLEHTKRAIAEEWAKRQEASPDFPSGPAPGAEILSLDASHAWASVEHSIEGLFESSGAAALLEAMTSFYERGRARDLLRESAHALLSVADEFVTDTQSRISHLGAEKRIANQELARVHRAREQLNSESEKFSTKNLERALTAAGEDEHRRMCDALAREATKAVDKLKETANSNLDAAIDSAELSLTRAVNNAALKLDRGNNKNNIARAFRELAQEFDRIEREAFENPTALSTHPPTVFEALTWKDQIHATIDVGGGFTRFLYKPLELFWKEWAVQKQRANFVNALDEARGHLIASAAQRAHDTVKRQRASAVNILERRRADLGERLERLEQQLQSDGLLKGQELAAKQTTLEERLVAATQLRRRLQAHAERIEAGAELD
jgi:hypothetical protein